MSESQSKTAEEKPLLLELARIWAQAAVASDSTHRGRQLHAGKAQGGPVDRPIMCRLYCAKPTRLS